VDFLPWGTGIMMLRGMESDAMFAIVTASDFLAKLREDLRQLQGQIDDSGLAMNCILSACHIHEWVWARWLKSAAPITIRGTGHFGDDYPMGHAYKDLVSGAELGANQGIPMPVLAAATAAYQAALLRGHGEKDKGGMVCAFEDLLGVQFRSRTDQA